METWVKRLQQAWYQSSSLRLRWFKWQIVTNSMYANWYVEYEFITKNQFHNWTSQLVCIWHIFRKLGYFWLFLRAPVQATSGDKNKTLVLEPSKRAKNNPISKKCAKCVLALMSNYEIDFWWWIHILYFKYEWDLPTLSLAWFFLLSYWISDNVMVVRISIPNLATKIVCTFWKFWLFWANVDRCYLELFYHFNIWDHLLFIFHGRIVCRSRFLR